MGGGGRHWVAYISKFTKRYVRLFQIFVLILSFFLTIYWRMKFRLTKASPYDVQLVKSIHQYFRFSEKSCQYREFRAGTGLK